MKKIILKISGMHCASCAANIENALKKEEGIKSANVNFASEKLYLEFDEIEIRTSPSARTFNADNSQFVVDFLWAIGLAQKSDAYVKGPMGTDYKQSLAGSAGKKDIGNFASTGGWTLAKGKAVNYLGRYELFNLTDEQQGKVAEIAKKVEPVSAEGGGGGCGV